MMLEQLGVRVRSLREARGWTRAYLADRAGISLRFLADVEHGTGNVSVQRLWEVSQALGVSLSTVFAGLGERPSRGKLALVGLRGAGKSTVGAALAQALGWQFIEVDRQVEQAAGLRLGDLFEYHGAGRYRELEREVLANLLDAPGEMVLATGGSVVTAVETWEILRRRSRTVWLHASPESHLARVEAQGDFRPMRGRADALTELKDILRVRGPLYAQAALTVETEGRMIAEVVAEAREWALRPA
jgi:XRE family aerobic/anaerobic benzoate catabolism transcriptional regulator